MRVTCRGFECDLFFAICNFLFPISHFRPMDYKSARVSIEAGEELVDHFLHKPLGYVPLSRHVF